MKGISLGSLILIFTSIQLFSQDFSPFYCDVQCHGENILNPFTGGFLTPQFSTIDFDDDGDQDLFVFDRAGDVPMIFLNEDGTYVYHPENKAEFRGVYNWALMRDLNKDRISDIFFAADSVAGVEVKLGRRINGELSFQDVEFANYQYNALNFPFSNSRSNIYVASTDIPAINDVDKDGDLDIVSFDTGGSQITFYRNMTVERGLPLEALEFEYEEDCYGGLIESEFTQDLFLSEVQGECGDGLKEESNESIKALHSGSTLVSYDVTGNGLDDLIIGDLTSNHLALAQNGGSINQAWFNAQVANFPDYNVSVDLLLMVATYILDVDNDGIDDMIVAPNSRSNVENMENIWFYKNMSTDGGLDLNLIQENFLTESTLEFGRYTSPVFVDVDGDGLQDIIVGTSGRHISAAESETRLIYIQNIGTASVPIYDVVDSDWLNFSEYINDVSAPAPTFGDMDGDSDLDLIIGTDVGNLIYLENLSSTGNEMAFGNPVFEFHGINVSKRAKPAIIDIDQDGLMDLVIGEHNNNTDSNGKIGGLNYFRNSGTSSNAQFDNNVSASENDPVLGDVNTQTQLSSRAGSAPVFIRDGEDYLLFVGSEDGDIYMYDEILGNGAGSYNLLTSDFGPFVEGKVTTPSFADIDDDEYYEVIIGNFRGGLSLFNTDIKVNLTGITDIIQKEVDIFPNPVSNELYIRGEVDDLKEIHIIGVEGQVLVSNNVETTINLDRLRTGCYVVELIFETGAVYKRLIKF